MDKEGVYFVVKDVNNCEEEVEAAEKEEEGMEQFLPLTEVEGVVEVTKEECMLTGMVKVMEENCMRMGVEATEESSLTITFQNPGMTLTKEMNSRTTNFNQL